MNKQIIITALLALVAMAGQGQEIKRVTTKPENFMEHMNMYGYKVFTYDISSLRDVASGFTIVIREFNQHGMIDEKKLEGFRTRTMISDFDEEDQRIIYAKKNGDELSKTLSIGFSPVQSDSIELVTLRSDRHDGSPYSLTLKPIPGAPQMVYRYEKIPYQATAFELNTFIPLVLYGSFWWDRKTQTRRFCGEMELTEEKARNNNCFKNSPHYYIIGAIFHK